jgi:hypothetical protein
MQQVRCTSYVAEIYQEHIKTVEINAVIRFLKDSETEIDGRKRKVENRPRYDYANTRNNTNLR